MAWLFFLSAFAAELLTCPICGMHFRESARTSFGAAREGRPIRVCSFTCARRLPGGELTAHDFKTGDPIDVKRAWFLVKSKNLVKELDFDMPPSVVAFTTETAAQTARTRLKDGAVVQGFEQAVKAYE